MDQKTRHHFGPLQTYHRGTAHHCYEFGKQPNFTIIFESPSRLTMSNALVSSTKVTALNKSHIKILLSDFSAKYTYCRYWFENPHMLCVVKKSETKCQYFRFTILAYIERRLRSVYFRYVNAIKCFCKCKAKALFSLHGYTGSFEPTLSLYALKHAYFALASTHIINLNVWIQRETYSLIPGEHVLSQLSTFACTFNNNFN